MTDNGSYNNDSNSPSLAKSNELGQSGQSGTSVASLADEDDEPNIGGICGSKYSLLVGPRWQFYFVIAAFMVLTLLESANSTSTSTALVALGTALPDATSSQLEWVGNSYMLTGAVLQLPIASLSNIWGRKPMVLISFFLFIAGSAVAGSAHNIATLLSGRTIQGIGGAGTLVLSEVCIADMVALRSRARYYALISVMWAIGSGLGPLIGGGFTKSVHDPSSNLWRWIFLLNLPIAGVPFVISLLVLKETGRKDVVSKVDSYRKVCKTSNMKQFDWIGTFMIVSSSTAFILGMTLGGVTFPWSSFQVLLPLLLGFFGLLGYGLYEVWGTTSPMLAIKVLFANRSATIAYFHAMVQGFMMEALPYYLPLFYQGVLLYSPLISGIALIPFAGIVLPSATISGWIVCRYEKYKWISATGWMLLTLGLGLLLLPSEKNRSVGTWLGPLFPTSIGLGILYSVLGTAVQAPQQPKDWADAAAMMSFVRSMGEAIGVAVGGAIFASEMAAGTANLHLPPSVDPKESFILVKYIREMSVSDPVKAELQTVLTSSMHTVYYLYIGLSGLCLVLSCCITEFSLDQDKKTDHDHHRKFSRRTASSDSSTKSDKLDTC